LQLWLKSLRKCNSISFKEVATNEDFIEFLQVLIRNKLTNTQKHASIEDADNAGGYCMVLYLIAPKTTRKKKN